MEAAELEVDALTWDERNEEKLNRHGVSAASIEEVLSNAPRFFVNFPARGASHIMIGPDGKGHFYFAPMIPTTEPGTWYVVTAFRVSARRARRVYGTDRRV